MSGYRIRTASSADAPAIARVHVQAWRESYRGLLPDAMLAGLSVETRAGVWADILDTREDAPLVLVASDARGIVGFGSAGRVRDKVLGAEGEVTAIYLLDRVKRQGLGRDLFSRLMTALAARGFASAGLRVLARNEPARRFYEAMGGRIGRLRPDPQGDTALNEIAYLWDDLTRFDAPPR